MYLDRIIDKAFEKTGFRVFESALPEAHASVSVQEGRLVVPASLLQELAREAFHDASFYLRRSHLAAWAALLEDPAATENDRFVVTALIRNALVAAEGELALCQDTGTSTIVAWKSEGIWTSADDDSFLATGTAQAYKRYYLRSSQVAARSMFDEYDTGDNQPSQIHIHAVPDSDGEPSYRFLFVAKGGGSANKTSLFQMTKALLEPARFEAFLREKVAALGVAACPPYRLAVVVGGTSSEENLSVLKLATTEILDNSEYFGQEPGAGIDNASNAGSTGSGSGFGPEPSAAHAWIHRDAFWERRLMEIASESGLGAQFGGIALAMDARVIRLARHAGSCPVSIGVSCSAHRNILAIIDRSGVRIEKLEKNPAAYLRSLGGTVARLAENHKPSTRVQRTERPDLADEIPATHINLDLSMTGLKEALSILSPGDRVLLSGTLLVARDAAHARWHALITKGNALPGYLKEHPIYYAGPSATPEGKTIGSFGPTTAQRMDGYAEELMSRGAALVTLAKGNRASSWTEACKRYGGFYLGTIGGAAALIAEENILESEILDYADLGMEAVRRIRVRDLPAFLVTDDKGGELYSGLPATTVHKARARSSR